MCQGAGDKIRNLYEPVIRKQFKIQTETFSLPIGFCPDKTFFAFDYNDIDYVFRDKFIRFTLSG